MPKKLSRIIYAGNRDISVRVLKFIISQGIKPLALLVFEGTGAHDKELIGLCNYLDDSLIMKGGQFRTEQAIKLLNNLKPDYILCVHFPCIIPKEVLEIPKEGVVNLHPAYLPYNRGWHTPTWAIEDGTPYGATLHFMNEEIDAGDIIHQEKIEVLPGDTADILYKRVKALEFEVFKKAWPFLMSGTYGRKPQPAQEGTTHKKKDLSAIQFIDINKQVKAGDLIKRFRALTTNSAEEAAYYKDKGKLYRVQIKIIGGDQENKI